MSHAANITLRDAAARKDVAAYEKALAAMALSEKLGDCQKFNERADEASMAKSLMLFLAGGEEAAHEVARIIAWKHRVEKAQFLLEQVHTADQKLQYAAIDLLGCIKEPFSVPSLAALYRIEQPELSKRIIEAIGAMRDPVGIKTIKAALTAKDPAVARVALANLALRIEEVPWKAFAVLMASTQAELRQEAAFAIALRREPSSAANLLRAITTEQDRGTRLKLLQYVGMIPSRKSLMPLLTIVTRDPDQKARLAASRALDRLQGLLHPREIFRLRNTADRSIKADVVVRIGRFGGEIEQHKEYLRKTLRETHDVLITQVCLQALGYLVERGDRELLSSYVSADPLTAYNATMALTKLWREGDRTAVLHALATSTSTVQKQIILKYLVRRRGLGCDAPALFAHVRDVIESSENINLRYLSYCLLEYAPSVATVRYLVLSYRAIGDGYLREAIMTTLKNLARHHAQDFLTLIDECDRTLYAEIVRVLPTDIDPSFFGSLAAELCRKFQKTGFEDHPQELCTSILAILVTNPAALKAFAGSISEIAMKRTFLDTLADQGTPEAIAAIAAEIADMLRDHDAGIRARALKLLGSMHEPSMVPRLIVAAESSADTKWRDEIRGVARMLIKSAKVCFEPR